MIDGAAALLETLSLYFCVASNAPWAEMELSLGLTGLRHHFGDRVFSAYDVGAWKPDPGLFLHAAAARGVAPSHCPVVEDSEGGVTAGVAAGMRVVAPLPDGVPEGLPTWLPAAVPAIRHLSEVERHL